MSEVHVEDHATAIQTPQQLVAVVALAFLVPIAMIVMIVQIVTGGIRVDSRAMSEDAVARRLKPVGEVALAQTAPPSAGAAAPTAASSDGSKVYQTVCVACHGSGLVGAPKVGDKAAWKPRLAQGLSTLHEHAVKGIRAMPPKGGNASLSDGDVSAAVDYMVSQSK
ncbi:MAG TPA: c-type cytochrome [Burkholderiales bacterium]|nr:c-type cytochrome [Burkholderiales bacterium]